MTVLFTGQAPEADTEPLTHDFDTDLADLHADAVRDRVRSLVLGYPSRVGSAVDL